MVDTVLINNNNKKKMIQEQLLEMLVDSLWLNPLRIK